MRKTMPVAQRVLGESHQLTLRMRGVYAVAFYEDPAATLDDLREAVTTLEEIEPIARRVLGSAHPVTTDASSRSCSQIMPRTRTTRRATYQVEASPRFWSTKAATGVPRLELVDRAAPAVGP